MADGDPAAARSWLCALGEEERISLFPRFAMDVTDDVHMVRIAMAAGDHQLAESSLAAAEQREKLNPDVRSIVGTAAHARGLLGGGHLDVAIAMQLFKDAPRPLALASALEDLGRADVGQGAKDQGWAPSTLTELLE
jgi:hypothetical protein